MTAFPGRTLHAENIVWGGNDKDGFHSSHLITSRMTNLGPSEFGPATGKTAEIQVIAHCVVKANRVIEEWLVRDNYSLARQLGFDPLALARQRAATPVDDNSRFARWCREEIERVGTLGRTPAVYPTSPEADPEAFIQAALQNLWNARLPGSCRSLYAQDARLHAAGRGACEGVEQIECFYEELQTALPDARLGVDYLCSQAMRDDAQYVAARWTLVGRHLGGVRWGKATGAPLLILGESQYRLMGGKVVEEWLLFDELAVLTQACRHHGGT